MTVTARQTEVWQLFADVCNDNGVPPYTVLHRNPEGSKQVINIPNTSRSNEIYRGPGPKNTAAGGGAPLPPGTTESCWVVFHGQELRSGDSAAGDTSSFMVQMGRAMCEICALEASTQAFITLSDNDWIEQAITGFQYRIENPVLSEDQGFYTCWVIQEQ